MEAVENNVIRILQGQAVEESQEFCDFSLLDQNQVLASKGVTATVPDTFKPVLKESVVYIVMATLINDAGEVLMMQEAKSRCAGQWYLPAGRMEPGETIVEAAKREVLEETGLTFDPTTLLMIESAAGSWFRFALTGKVTGGELKVPAKADAESLQAKFVQDLGELSLRADDILTSVDRAREHYKAIKGLWHPDVLPVSRTHSKNLLRLICIVRKKTTNKVHVLVSEKTEAHLPACEINPSRSLHATLKKYMTEIFGSNLPPHKPHGIMTLEHKPATEADPEEADGLCITLLVSVRCALEEAHPIDKYTWLELSDSLGKRLMGRLDRNRTIPLNVIRCFQGRRMALVNSRGPKIAGGMFAVRRMIAQVAVRDGQKQAAKNKGGKMTVFRKIVDGYNHLLNHRPRLLLGTQSGLLMAAGDFLSQTCVERVPLAEVEPYRVLRFGLIGACIAGPGLKAWFYGLDKLVGREMTAKKAMIKTFIDQGILAPPMLASLVGSVQFAKTKDVNKTIAWGQEHGWEILKTNWALWPAVQMVNFCYVSLEYRLLLAQSVALFWNVYLAYKANRDDDLQPSPAVSSSSEEAEKKPCPTPAPSESFAPLLSFGAAVKPSGEAVTINEDDLVAAISLPAVISPPPPSSKTHYVGIYRLYSEFSQCESFWH